MLVSGNRSELFGVIWLERFATHTLSINGEIDGKRGIDGIVASLKLVINSHGDARFSFNLLAVVKIFCWVDF